MFGDVIQIITRQSVGDYCSDSETPPEFCSDALAPIFLKLFAVLVGGTSDCNFTPATMLVLTYTSVKPLSSHQIWI